MVHYSSVKDNAKATAIKQNDYTFKGGSSVKIVCLFSEKSEFFLFRVEPSSKRSCFFYILFWVSEKKSRRSRKLSPLFTMEDYVQCVSSPLKYNKSLFLLSIFIRFSYLH